MKIRLGKQESTIRPQEGGTIWIVIDKQAPVEVTAIAIHRMLVEIETLQIGVDITVPINTS